MFSPSIAVIGLGYVGLPLALALSRHFSVNGFDTSESRVAELNTGIDRTSEVAPDVLAEAALEISSDPAVINGADFFIITVPTPVNSENRPDLSYVLNACRTVGGAIKKGAVVVLESTVYPGVTEDICGPELEAASGLVSGKDFFLGYSPERMNPGDKEHTVDKITKVVAGQTPETTAALSKLYGTLTAGGVFKARNIKTAEAAKVIENAQRDINIAFINEISMIFSRLGLSTHDVLEAAKSKWNFLPFEPGLVGGHCIGVDPFYLAHVSEEVGHHPEIILAGRKINDGMAAFTAARIHDRLGALLKDRQQGRVLVLGLTFKENVPDLRNTKVVDLIAALKSKGHSVDVHDALANTEEARAFFELELLDDLAECRDYGCVVCAVPHDEYRSLNAQALEAMVNAGGLVVDLKGIWRNLTVSPGIERLYV